MAARAIPPDAWSALVNGPNRRQARTPHLRGRDAAGVARVVARGRRLVLLGFLSLCAVGSQSAAAAPPRVITSIPPIADLVRNVGGEVIELQTLVPAGVSSHTFQPTPRNVQYLTQADLVILNGLKLEWAIAKLVRCCNSCSAMITKTSPLRNHQ